MKITVRFYGIAHDYTEVREWNPDLDEGTRIDALLEKIVMEFPKLRELVFEEDGSFRDYLAVSVNNVDILGLEGISTVLNEGNMVFIMPPIGGG